jgi:hypothetical protein
VPVLGLSGGPALAAEVPRKGGTLRVGFYVAVLGARLGGVLIALGVVAWREHVDRRLGQAFGRMLQRVPSGYEVVLHCGGNV